MAHTPFLISAPFHKVEYNHFLERGRVCVCV